jgi:hypothetical protein
LISPKHRQPETATEKDAHIKAKRLILLDDHGLTALAPKFPREQANGCAEVSKDGAERSLE